MHKVIGVMSLVSALVISEGVNAQGVDLAKLPSIDPIAATTDIRPYLALGVPLRQVRAALRRAWVVDSRIRDSAASRERLDFNDPSGIPGFSPLELSGNAKIIAALEGKIVTNPSR